MNEFAPVIRLSALDGRNGFRIDGERPYDRAGFAVASAGDINGDGFDDIIVSAPFADPNGVSSGASYVIFGKAGGSGSVIDLGSLNGRNGFQISGEAGLDFSGRSVAAAGDINGDGFDDIIIGANGASPNGEQSGAAYVVFGKAGGFAADLQLSALDGRNGFQISGEAAFDLCGRSVQSAGDINGDGFDDIIIGAPFADPLGPYSGASYVVFGKAGGFAANLNLSSINGRNGFQISGGFEDYSGFSVASASDVNGDGFDDLMISAPFADPHGTSSGVTYVVFGKAQGFTAGVFLSAINGENGFKITGAAAGERSGISIAAAGDINGDGIADLIIGAPEASPSGAGSGASYVVFGRASGFPSSLDLGHLNGHNGFKISGGSEGDHSGYSVASAGDVNGDGFDDLIIGAYGWGQLDQSNGIAYVVFGKASGFAGDFNLATLDGSNGFRIAGGGTGNQLGRSVAGAGDINGDGFADLIVGADRSDAGGFDSGASYVIYGHRALTDVQRIGTNMAQTINGGFGDDTIVARGGDDRLIGWEGDDRMAGGAGNDVLIGGTGQDRMSGGTGNDRFDFRSLAESPLASRDVIIDFEAGHDKINLAPVDATAGGTDDAFTFVGCADFTGLGQLRWFQQGGNTFVEVNTTGSLAPDMRIQLTGLITLDQTDFVL